ncbi:hypothetical protein VNO80_20511 [Phaseolus coccineus]|uniref:Transmembrane protein n=1 Tax=Phaseolus coccineus TaxID=3886 RepID=A0AAN9M667_PHACN
MTLRWRFSPMSDVLLFCILGTLGSVSSQPPNHGRMSESVSKSKKEEGLRGGRWFFSGLRIVGVVLGLVEGVLVLLALCGLCLQSGLVVCVACCLVLFGAVSIWKAPLAGVARPVLLNVLRLNVGFFSALLFFSKRLGFVRSSWLLFVDCGVWVGLSLENVSAGLWFDGHWYFRCLLMIEYE